MGWTGLLDATDEGHEEVVQYLLHSNADTEVQNQVRLVCSNI
jgi:ankyrin repeat protein